MVTKFRHSEQPRVDVSPAAVKGKKSATDITASDSGQTSLVTNICRNTTFSSPSCSALEVSVRLPLRTAPCQKRRSAPPSAGISVLPRQLRSSDLSHSTCRLRLEFPHYRREGARQKQIKRSRLLSLHRLGQWQPPKIQHEVSEQPCTLLNAFGYFGGIIFGGFY